MNDFSVLPSALAYLYGDVLESEFGGTTRLGFSEKLPCREIKIKKKDLAKMIVVAGFCFLRKAGHLQLAPGKTGRILKKKCVHVTSAGSGVGFGGGLEPQLLANVSGKLKKDDVASIVWRLWNGDSAHPFDDVIRWAQEYLIVEGYFYLEERRGIGKLLGKKRLPHCERVLTLQREADALRAMLMAFRASEPEMYQQLWKDVGKGIASRQEQQDIDFDD